MIQARELRIGNYILNDNALNAVESVNRETVQLRTLQNNIITAQISLIKPLSISELWLKRLGFQDRSGSLANEMGYGIQLNSLFEIAWYKQDPNNIRFQTIHSGGSMILPFFSVHQLQNFHYSLTGQDLTISTPVNA